MTEPMLSTVPPELIGLPTLSPSALTAYEICGRRGHYYHTADVPRTTDWPLAIGSAYHVGQEELHKGQTYEAALGYAIGALADKISEETFIDDGEYTHQAAIDALARMFASHQAVGAKWDNVTHIEAEVRADFGSEHRVLHGFIDLVIDNGDVLVDHKTAKKMWSSPKKDGDPRKLLQAPLYAEAWEFQTGVSPRFFAYDVMTIAGKFMRVWVNVSKDVRAPFLKRWRDMADSIKLYEANGMEMPCNPSSFLCSRKSCNFWNICEMGTGLDKSIQQAQEGISPK